MEIFTIVNKQYRIVNDYEKCWIVNINSSNNIIFTGSLESCSAFRLEILREFADMTYCINMEGYYD